MGSSCASQPRGLQRTTTPRRPVRVHAQLWRVDRALSSLGYCTRSECSQFLKSHKISADGVTILKPSTKVDISTMRIDKQPLECPHGILAVLHKPIGYTCSHDPSEGPLVYDLLPQIWLKRRPAVTTIGRLDKMTSGLLLVTTLRDMVHKLTSPRHQVPKRYRATLKDPPNLREQAAMVEEFESGQLLLHGEEKPCRPAQLLFVDGTSATVCVTEGRYHQVRRMFAACGADVVALHRDAIGKLSLSDLALPEGAWAHLPHDTMV